MMNRILLLISCSKKKRQESCSARDLYQGNLFKKAQIFADLYNFQTQIISSEYGLLSNEDIIMPYEKIIMDMRDNLKNKTSEEIMNFIKNNQIKTLIILLGNNYFLSFEKAFTILSEKINVYRFKSKSNSQYITHLKMLMTFGDLYNEKIFLNYKTKEYISFRDVLS